MSDSILELTEHRDNAVQERIQSATFPRQIQSITLARHFVTEAIGQHPAADEAVLLASEVVTNALVHARDATTVTVSVAVTATFIRIDILDDGQTGIPHWRDADSQAEDGRGFQIVNALAQRWGFTRERDRTCCWFEITASRTA